VKVVESIFHPGQEKKLSPIHIKGVDLLAWVGHWLDMESPWTFFIQFNSSSDPYILFFLKGSERRLQRKKE
jgi:hypothetical protein